MESELSALLSPELLKEIRRYRFWVRRSLDQSISGSYRSAFRGRGMEFDEVREYVPGDEVRTIDWKVTARTGRPFIKVFREERDLTVILALDVSASMWTGTRGAARAEVAARAAAVLATIALANNDRVGVVTFANKVERALPPRRARSAAWQVLKEVLAIQGVRERTSFVTLSDYLTRMCSRRSAIFVLSDFFATDTERGLAVLSRRHDVTALLIRDPGDGKLPQRGVLDLLDPESGEIVTVDCSSSAVRIAYQEAASRALEERARVFRRLGIATIELPTDGALIPPIRRFFESRMKGG